jgi:hypothetical protein
VGRNSPLAVPIATFINKKIKNIKNINIPTIKKKHFIPEICRSVGDTLSCIRIEWWLQTAK